MHALGWELQQHATPDDPRTVPDYNALPPSKKECPALQSALKRMVKFYADGREKQEYHTSQIQAEKLAFQSAAQRIDAQLNALKKHPADHTRRRDLEKELQHEYSYIQKEIRARDAASVKLEVLNKKREELVASVTFFESLLTSHCNTLPPEPTTIA